MGFKNKLSNATKLRSIPKTLRSKTKPDPEAPSESDPAMTESTRPAPAHPQSQWEFVVTAHPIKHVPSDLGAATRDTGNSTAAETADTEGADSAPSTGWEWLALPCWGAGGSRYCPAPRTGDWTFGGGRPRGPSRDDGSGSGDSSMPSVSMVDRVIEAAVEPVDDVSDVTSAPSIDTMSTGEGDDDDDDDNDDDSKSR